MARGIDRADRARDPVQPASARLARGRHAAVRVFVPKIPAPEGGMAGERAGAFAREQRLSIADRLVRGPGAGGSPADPGPLPDAESPGPAAPRGPFGVKV